MDEGEGNEIVRNLKHEEENFYLYVEDQFKRRTHESAKDKHMSQGWWTLDLQFFSGFSAIRDADHTLYRHKVKKKEAHAILLLSYLAPQSKPPTPATGHTERRKTQREERMVVLPALTAERGRANKTTTKSGRLFSPIQSLYTDIGNIIQNCCASHTYSSMHFRTTKVYSECECSKHGRV